MKNITASEFAKLNNVEGLQAAAIQQEEVLSMLIDESLELFNSAPIEKLRLNEQLEYTNEVFINTMGPFLNNLIKAHTNWAKAKATNAPNKAITAKWYNSKVAFRNRLELGEKLLTEYKNLRNDRLNNFSTI